MKQLTLLLMALLCGFAPIEHNHAQTSWSSGKFMLQAWAQTMSVAKDLQENTNMGLVDRTCVLGAVLKKGNSARFTTYLKSGTTYVFFAGGDEDVTDLDLKLYGSSGNLLEADKKSNAKAAIVYEPSQSGDYTIELIYYSGTATTSFACMAIMEEYGNRVPISNMIESGKKFFLAGELLNRKSNIKFHDYPNQWCLYTSILDDGEYTQISNLDLGDEDHIFYAVGDQNIKDADLYLYLNEETTMLERDTDRDPTPIMTYRTGSVNQYKLRIKNYESRGKSLLIAGICTD